MLKEGDSKGRERDIEWKKADIPTMERMYAILDVVREENPTAEK